jgi:hypothetical protein
MLIYKVKQIMLEKQIVEKNLHILQDGASNVQVVI